MNKETKFDINKCPRTPEGHWLAQTREGKSATIVSINAPGSYPIAAIVDCTPQLFRIDGQFYCPSIPNHQDLINIPERIKWTVWLNVQRDYIELWHSKENADNASKNRLACVKVEIDCEKGEGL